MKTTLALLFASGLVMAHPSLATTICPRCQELIATENSATDLSATYNGSPLTVIPPVGQLAFGIVAPPHVQFEIDTFPGGFNEIGFIEPENPTLVNLILGEGDQLAIISDFPISLLPNKGDVEFVSDGTRVVGIGIDRSNGGPFPLPIALTFHDNAASAEPDGGSTVSLLGCALLGLAALRRKLGC